MKHCGLDWGKGEAHAHDTKVHDHRNGDWPPDGLAAFTCFREPLRHIDDWLARNGGRYRVGNRPP